MDILNDNASKSEVKKAVQEIQQWINDHEAEKPAPTKRMTSQSSNSLYPKAVNTERTWKPVGDGERFWTDPSGFTTAIENVPQEVRETLFPSKKKKE
jgi:hypothetical protein